MFEGAPRDWQIVVEEEVRARQRCDECIQGIAPKEMLPRRLREWWAAISAVLQAYSRLSVTQSITFPPNLAAVLSQLTGHLAVGHIPDPIKDAASEGRSGLRPGERRDIGYAVAYLRACQNRLSHNKQSIQINDKHPTKTVAQLYNVQPATVRSWQKNVEPAFLGVNDINAEILIHLMEDGAKRYTQASRSTAAIARRDKRRPQSN